MTENADATAAAGATTAADTERGVPSVRHADQAPQSPAPRTPARQKQRTQGERSSATRSIVNDAIIQCLVDSGYAGTTMATITEAAGVSRGAITHQFSSKRHMLIAAIENLAERNVVEFRRLSADLPEAEHRVPAVLTLLWTVFESDLYAAMLEMWNAARTDPELREAVRESELEHGLRHRQLFGELLGPQISGHPNFGVALDLTFNLMRGMALTGVLRDNPSREQILLDEWSQMFARLVSDDANASSKMPELSPIETTPPQHARGTHS